MDVPSLEKNDLELARKAAERLMAECGKTIVGQRAAVEQLIISLMAGGHALLVGVPGLAKTLLIHTLAAALDLQARRVQFTPDLMPSDITGTDILQEEQGTGRRTLRFLPGPLFANLVLADEINRSPPRTQAALLEAMQEGFVTIGGTRHPLPNPFFVLATQNPIEQEGTYPLPEAQQDRFLLSIHLDYPSEEEEYRILERAGTSRLEAPTPVAGSDDIARMRRVTSRLPIAGHVIRYALRLLRATRPQSAEAPAMVRRNLAWGAGPRAGQHLILAAKARAVLRGRPFVTTEDVAALAPAVLRHRLVPTFDAEADGLTTEAVLAQLLEQLPRGEKG